MPYEVSTYLSQLCHCCFHRMTTATTPCRSILVWTMTAAMLSLAAPAGAQVASSDPADAALSFEEPLFDIRAIENEPLDLKVLDEQVNDGLILRKFEFTGEVRKNENGQLEPVRIEGLFVLPEHGEALPGLLWCQGGMSPANPVIPSIYARKGYACIVITLPTSRASWTAWDASDPRNANLSRYAVYQLRAVTVLSHEPRVDRKNLGVVGASYGGFFSTLVAGVDPRIKAGAAFFAAGHHDLGTNLPQFTKMPDKAAAQTWMRMIDPGWRHEKRDMPFLWTLPSNDNWFYFPAVVKTYELAKSKDKRLAIIPYWTHGFPPNVDQEIFDWFDVHLKKTREPYIQPSALSITKTNDGLKATWTSDGRPMKVAQLVVSPNAPAADESPWLGQWVHRLHQPLPATISNDGLTASAIIPVLDPTRPMLVYGNVIDEHDVITSTTPLLLAPPYPANSPTGQSQWNGCLWGTLETADVAILDGMARSPGESDTTTAYQGQGSVRVTPAFAAKKRSFTGSIKLYHVPYLAHQLKVALRSASPATVRITVEALPPANWQGSAVKAVMTVMDKQPVSLTKPSVAAETLVKTTAQWQVYTLDVPAPESAIEGYDLQISLDEPADVVWWFDAVHFTPVVSGAGQ